MPPEPLPNDVSTPGAPFVTAIRWHAEQDPHRIADADASIARGELDAGTNRLARAHEERGVTAGSFVTIGLPNSTADGPLPVVVSNGWTAPAAIAGRRSGTS